MTTIQLTPEEHEVLGQVLQNSLATLDVEILHTDHQDFKSYLKHRREVLAALAERLPSPAMITA
jgi:hypothetical protein